MYLDLFPRVREQLRPAGGKGIEAMPNENQNLNLHLHQNLPRHLSPESTERPYLPPT